MGILKFTRAKSSLDFPNNSFIPTPLCQQFPTPFTKQAAPFIPLFVRKKGITTILSRLVAEDAALLPDPHPRPLLELQWPLTALKKRTRPLSAGLWSYVPCFGLCPALPNCPRGPAHAALTGRPSSCSPAALHASPARRVRCPGLPRTRLPQAQPRSPRPPPARPAGLRYPDETQVVVCPLRDPRHHVGRCSVPVRRRGAGGRGPPRHVADLPRARAASLTGRQGAPLSASGRTCSRSSGWREAVRADRRVPFSAA